METIAPISNAEAKPSSSPWQLFWQRLKRRRIAMFGGVVFVFVYIGGSVGGVMWP
jgi:hypothetical protein